jgi:hypothetical protein
MWKANGKTTVLLFLGSTFPKSETNARCYFCRQNNPEVSYHSIQIYGRGQCMLKKYQTVGVIDELGRALCSI